MDNIDEDSPIQRMSALEILRETVRILRFNLSSFMAIAAFLICPVSALLLSDLFVDRTLLKRLTVRLMLLAKSAGLPLWPFVKQSCQKLSETAISSALCFPLFATLLLFSKAAVVYSVDCTYSRKQVDSSKLYAISLKIWRRVLLTYLWVCMVNVGCLTFFLVLLASVSSVLSVIGFSEALVVYIAIFQGLVFSVVFANAVIICNVAVVISVLEDASGPQAMLRSSVLIRGQTQVGLLIFLVSTVGMAFVEGLFEHRVKTLSYGDGSSRVWEGPLLVVMYSFVLLVDFMMNAVFYFSCKFYSMEASGGIELRSILESIVIGEEPVLLQADSLQPMHQQ